MVKARRRPQDCQNGAGWKISAVPEAAQKGRVPVVKLSKQSAEFGIVVRDEAVMLGYYRDVMQLPYKGTRPVPGGVLHRFGLGETGLKLMVPDTAPAAANLVGDVQESTGIRYWTIWVEDLDDAVGSCVAGGGRAVRPIAQADQGIRYAVVADPEGNLAEFVEQRDR